MGYREFIVSRHHTLSAASGALFILPRSLPSCADRLDTYIFSSLSLPHCVYLLSNLSLDSFQARDCTSQTRHISSASWHPTASSRPSCHKDSHFRQTTYLQ